MSQFRSTKRSKELSRKARHEAKEARRRERREKAQSSGEADDDIDWSQAVGFAPPSGEDGWGQAVSSSLPDDPAEEGSGPGRKPAR